MAPVEPFLAYKPFVFNRGCFQWLTGQSVPIPVHRREQVKLIAGAPWLRLCAPSFDNTRGWNWRGLM
jgi:hypothetical protein